MRKQFTIICHSLVVGLVLIVATTQSVVGSVPLTDLAIDPPDEEPRRVQLAAGERLSLANGKSSAQSQLYRLDVSSKSTASSAVPGSPIKVVERTIVRSILQCTKVIIKGASCLEVKVLERLTLRDAARPLQEWPNETVYLPLALETKDRVVMPKSDPIVPDHVRIPFLVPTNPLALGESWSFEVASAPPLNVGWTVSSTLAGAAMLSTNHCLHVVSINSPGKPTAPVESGSLHGMGNSYTRMIDGALIYSDFTLSLRKRNIEKVRGNSLSYEVDATTRTRIWLIQ